MRVLAQHRPGTKVRGRWGSVARRKPLGKRLLLGMNLGQDIGNGAAIVCRCTTKGGAYSEVRQRIGQMQKVGEPRIGLLDGFLSARRGCVHTWHVTPQGFSND